MSPLLFCPHTHCNNCLRFALGWRERVLGLVAGAGNVPLPDLSPWSEEERFVQRELFP